MTFAVGVFVLVLSLLAWAGQILSAVAPSRASGWGLSEAPEEVDPAFLADVRAECLWDSLTLWTLPLAAAFFLLGVPGWSLLGLIGGGMYLYFSGRGVLQRITLQRRGFRVGKPSTVRIAHLFLILWGASGVAMIVLAGRALLEGT